MKLNLADFWGLFGIPEPEEVYRFDGSRRFRFDFAWPQYLIAVEIEGGIWIKAAGSHNRPIHFMKDMTKYNLAALHGWRVFRFTPTQFNNGEAGEFLEELFRKLKETN